MRPLDKWMMSFSKGTWTAKKENVIILSNNMSLLHGMMRASENYEARGDQNVR